MMSVGYMNTCYRNRLFMTAANQKKGNRRGRGAKWAALNSKLKNKTEAMIPGVPFEATFKIESIVDRSIKIPSNNHHTAYLQSAAKKLFVSMQSHPFLGG